jgi:PAS domain S-box-containing protein
MIQTIFAGICLYAGSVHLLIGLRSQPRDRVHLTFAAISLLFGIYSINLVFLNAAIDYGSVSRFVATDKWGLLTNYLAYACLFWFIAVYTHAGQHLVPMVTTVGYVAIALSNFVLPYTWVYTNIELPATLDPVLTLSPWYSVEGPLTGLLLIVYPAYFITRQYRSGEREAARFLTVAVGIFAATYAWDIFLVEYDIVPFILLQQYGFLAFIVIMSLHLSGQAVEAEKQVRRLNLELEQRVEDRTAELSNAKNLAEAAVKELQKSETRLNHVLRSAGLAMWEFDLQTRETAVTDMFPHLLGYDPSEILDESGRKWRGYKIGHQSLAASLLHPDDKEWYAEKFGELISGNEKFDVEYRLLKANGQWNWIRDHGKIVKWDNSGKPLLAYGVVIDIDKMKHLQLELINAKDSAEAANRAKSTFLANMSHELRTPLNAILGHAQIMSRDQSLKPDMCHSIEAVNRSGDHLLVLINNVLEMSKIEAGKTVLSPAPFDIDALINDITMMFRDRIIEKGLEFKVTKEKETPRVIVADRGKISQILINLFSNAIRYTREGGITLKASVDRANSDTPHLVFKVEDTGEGIEAEHLELIFEPFKQSGEVSPQKTGTGLGLAISRQYARKMKGELTVQSQFGEKSVFRLEIPLVEAEAATSKEVVSPLRQIIGISGKTHDLSVLVADDEPSNRDVLIRLLAPVDFKIREAADGDEAVGLFESWSPDLVMMDIRMPTMDGIEAIKKIKATESGRSTPVIGMSASAFEEDRKRVLDSGADDFLCKPIREPELWEKIGRFLNVEFVYAEEAFSPDKSLEPFVKGTITKENIADLPEDLLEDMGAAVRGGYMERLAELAKRAAVIQPQLSEQLLKIIDDYDYETLSRLFLADEEDK